MRVCVGVSLFVCMWVWEDVCGNTTTSPSGFSPIDSFGPKNNNAQSGFLSF